MFTKQHLNDLNLKIWNKKILTKSQAFEKVMFCVFWGAIITLFKNEEYIWKETTIAIILVFQMGQ